MEFNLWVADLNVLGYEHSVLQPLTAAWADRCPFPEPERGMNE